jgi:hypothetical protein
MDFMHPITLRKGTLLDALESMTTKLRTPHRPEHWTDTDAERLEEVARFIRANAQDDRQLPATSRPEINHDENSG